MIRKRVSMHASPGKPMIYFYKGKWHASYDPAFCYHGLYLQAQRFVNKLNDKIRRQKNPPA